MNEKYLCDVWKSCGAGIIRERRGRSTVCEEDLTFIEKNCQTGNYEFCPHYEFHRRKEGKDVEGMDSQGENCPCPASGENR